ncbi:MAG: ribonucleoside-diphosphate reductase subunit alpha, partial [Pseudomonadota bacterium]
MKVQKRDGSLMEFDPNKILNRIKQQAKSLRVEADEIAVQTMQGMFDGISTVQLDELAANIAHNYTFSHPDYNKLAANLIISRLQKEVNLGEYEMYLSTLYEENRLNPGFYTKIIENMDWVKNVINPERDYNFDYFGISQLMNAYLLRNSKGKIIETPQMMYMRVAISLAKDLDEALEFYEQLSTQRISAATPILFNAGTKNQNMISCNLTYLKGDSLVDIMDTMKNVSIASSHAAGIGLCVDNLRSAKNVIKSTGGKAHGVLGVAKIVNELMNVYNQGGKRPGSCALYLSVWHKDILDFLELKLPTGDEKLRARDLFLALNVPNNFMRAVESGEDYYLFCPKDLKDNGIDFLNTHNERFEEEYARAVSLGIGERIKAEVIYRAIVKSLIETGVPYIHFIDHTNKRSNHSVYGKIKQSNLCIEIMQYSDEDTTAQCCLGSIPVQKHIVHLTASKPDGTNVETMNLSYDSLQRSTEILTKFLNRVIDTNHWSTPEAQKGGLEQRAIAIGIQGFSDLLNMLDVSFESDQANKLSETITSTIYEYAFKTSEELYMNEGLTYKNSDQALYGKIANSLLVAYM